MGRLPELPLSKMTVLPHGLCGSRTLGIFKKGFDATKAGGTKRPSNSLQKDSAGESISSDRHPAKHGAPLMLDR